MKRISNFLESIGTINRYMLLDRLRTDCDYFLGFGERSEKQLWAGSVKEHIWCMKVLYLLFPINEKPEWLSMLDILEYEKRMS